jgi:sulfane dehydrogenase subunit SoxC
VDGGTSWKEATLERPVSSKALTRFRLPWHWSGAPTTLLSRATDDKGQVQPSRKTWIKPFSLGQMHHNNSMQAWRVGANGKVTNVYI